MSSNLEKYLVIIKGEDKTSSISKIEYNEKNNLYVVEFHNSWKTYHYRKIDVLFLGNPEQIKMDDSLILIHNTPEFNVVKLLLFAEKYYRVFYKNGFNNVYRKNEVDIVKSSLSIPKSKNCFEYLKRISQSTGITDKDGHNILFSRYEKIDFIREDSVLGDYLGLQYKCNEN